MLLREGEFVLRQVALVRSVTQVVGDVVHLAPL